MTPAEFAAECIAKCAEGFDNEHAWLSWKKARAVQIKALPIGLRNKVQLAWANSTAKEFSK